MDDEIKFILRTGKECICHFIKKFKELMNDLSINKIKSHSKLSSNHVAKMSVNNLIVRHDTFNTFSDLIYM